MKPGRGRKASDWYFETPKTVSSIRTIKIGPTLCKCLERAHLQNKKNSLSIGGSYTEYYKNPEINEKGETIYRILPAVKGVDMNLPKIELVCVQENGTLISPDTMKGVSRIIHHELGLPFTYHSLRHTHATMLVEAGADIKDVQDRLGHAKIETTMNKYVHNTDEMKKKTADIFEQIALKA